MNEENQHPIRNSTNPQSQYLRMSADDWVGFGYLASFVCGFLFLILFVITSLPVFIYLGIGTLIVAGALWWWHSFREMMQELQRSRDKQRKDTPATKVLPILLGISLFCLGLLVPFIFESLYAHYWWLHLVIGPLSSTMTASGVAVIVVTVKPKSKRAAATSSGEKLPDRMEQGIPR